MQMKTKKSILTVVLLCAMTIFCCSNARAQLPSGFDAQQMLDAYNLLTNLDDIFVTTAAEVNGIPIMYDTNKWVQVSIDVLPLIPIKFGSILAPIPMWGNVNVKVDVLKEDEEYIPEITLSGGYWNLFYGVPEILASQMSDGAVSVSFTNWNIGACVSKTIAEKLRQHVAIQYSSFTGRIGGSMIDQMLSGMSFAGQDTSAFSPNINSSRLDLLFGVDYAFIPRRTGFFFIGYDLVKGEIFEKIGIRFGGWTYKLGIYPGNIVSLAPSIDWNIAF